MFSLQLPRSHPFWDLGGARLQPKDKYFQTAPWSTVQADGCKFGADEQATLWLSNFDLGMLGLKCRRPLAIAGCTHTHIRKEFPDSPAMGAAYAVASSYASCEHAM